MQWTGGSCDLISNRTLNVTRLVMNVKSKPGKVLFAAIATNAWIGVSSSLVT